MRKRNDLSPGDRRDLVLRLLRREASAQQLAEEYGVSDVSVYRWRDEFLEGGEAALSGRDSQARQIQQLKREIAERDRVVGELTIANRILKKLSEELPPAKTSERK